MRRYHSGPVREGRIVGKNGPGRLSPPFTWKNPPLPFSAQESIPVVLQRLRGGPLEIGEQGASDSDRVRDDVPKSSRNEEVANLKRRGGEKPKTNKTTTNKNPFDEWGKKREETEDYGVNR